MKSQLDKESGNDLSRVLNRTLPESSAEYMIFVTNDYQDKTTIVKPASRIEQIRKAALKLSDEYTKDYIWQRDAFNLEVVSRAGLLYLHGVTDYGDCIDDEWLIVYLLREVTRTFPDAWVRICDSDGEFLLIEAASMIPKWLSPESDENRVWIHDGQLKIIPSVHTEHASSQSGSSCPSISLAAAVETIRSTPDSLVRIPNLETEAFFRLEKYPENIASSVHHACVFIPRKVAYILHDRPRVIAPATEAFYERDPLSTQATFPTNRLSLRFPPVDMVAVSVRFTRVLFAQLRGHRFTPPEAWAKEFFTSVEAVTARGGETFRSQSNVQIMVNLGMKITFGLELMVASGETSNSRIVREVGLVLDGLAEDGDDLGLLPTDTQILSWKDVRREDDDSWLEIDIEALDRELNGSRRGEDGTPLPEKRNPAAASGDDLDSGFGDAQVQSHLRKIVSRFHTFLDDDDAGLDGAEFENVGEEDGDDGDNDNDDDDDGDDDINFDSDEFSHLMRELVGLPPDNEPVAEKSCNSTDNSPQKDAAEIASFVSLGTDTVDARDASDRDDILKLASQLEAELKEHGVLRLDAARNDMRITAVTKRESTDTAVDDPDSDSEGEVDVDYNLAKNLLESFKSQAGMPGPVGNILGLIGLGLPRDDDDADNDGEEEGA